MLKLVEEITAELRRDPYYPIPLELIGNGWQYTVYALEASWVLKIPKFYPAYTCSVFREAYLPIGKGTEAEDLIGIKVRTEHANSLVRTSTIPATHVGSPLFLEREILVQRRVNVPRSLAGWPVAKVQKFFTDYVRLVQLGWEFGLADTVHNFAVNTGYAADGELIFADFSEFENCFEEIEHALGTEKWRSSHDMSRLNDAQRSLLVDIYIRELTVEKFRTLWRRQLTDKPLASRARTTLRS